VFRPWVRHELLIAVDESPTDGRDKAGALRCLRESRDILLREHGQRRVRIGEFEESLDPSSIIRFDRPVQRPLQEVEGVRKRLGLAQPTLADEGPGNEKRDYEQAVDQGDRGSIEVVVVRGDELPDLVDERAEPESCDHRRQMLDGTVEEGEQKHECKEHEEAAPKHVGDVDPVGPDPWVAGGSQEPADPEE